MATVEQTRRQSVGDEAWALLRQLLHGERRRFLTVAAEHDLHPGQAGALPRMEPPAPLPLPHLATMLPRRNSNVTRLGAPLDAPRRPPPPPPPPALRPHPPS